MYYIMTYVKDINELELWQTSALKGVDEISVPPHWSSYSSLFQDYVYCDDKEQSNKKSSL